MPLVGFALSLPSPLRSAVAGGFSPLDLSPTLWLDASDAGTITESGGSVSQWDDKSGNGYHMVQATSSQQPTTGTVTQNGLNAIDFDGSADGMSVASFDMTGGQKFSIAAVFTAASGSLDVIMEQSPYYYSNLGAFIFYRNSTNTVVLGTRRNGGALSSFESTSTVTTTASVVVGTFDGTLSTDEVSLWVNSDGSGTRPSNANTNLDNISDTLYLGSRNNTSYFLDGIICEVIVGTTAWTAQQISDTENYLADKWGITLP